MLIGFKVRNFRSFAEEQSFSFSTSSDSSLADTHCLSTGIKSVPRVSKASVLFGPNGSGKSNLIRAFAVMRDLVLHSSSLSASEFGARYTPFLPPASGQGSTGFEVDLALQGVRYRYGFSYDQERIVAERLLITPSGKAQRWFERTWDPQTERELWEPFSQRFTGPRTMWRDATRPSALFLSTAAQLNARQLEPLFRWFEQGMKILSPSEPGGMARVAASLREEAFRSQMLQFLQSADIHIKDVRVPEADLRSTLSADSFGDRTPHGVPDPVRVQFSHAHNGSQVWLDAADESSGIQRLACLFGPLLAAMEHGSLLLIDEFDLSLHALVARYLIESMTSKGPPDCTAQVLLTSHNTTLMDVSVLRRDQIWLMALNALGASELTPAWRTASPPRRNELIGNAYLRGRFGAVPAIGPLTPLRTPAATLHKSIKRRKNYQPS
jgi:hypothetical protein